MRSAAPPRPAREPATVRPREELACAHSESYGAAGSADSVFGPNPCAGTRTTRRAVAERRRRPDDDYRAVSAAKAVSPVDRELAGYASLTMLVASAPSLTQRQEAILARVVECHVASGAPVGSRTLVEREGIEASPSTVRTELGILEEKGLLTHPHTSAGRIPTDLGYRYYVDRVLERLGPRSSGLAIDLSEAKSEVDAALRATTDALAQVTHLLALVSAPPLETTTVRHVEVLVLQPQLCMVVVITSTGGVTKRLFAFSEPVDPGLAEWAGEYLNERVAGLQLGAWLLRARFEDPSLSPRERDFLTELAPAFIELVEAGEGSLYVGGTAGLLDEFRADDLRGYRRLLEVLEQRAAVLELLRANLASKEPFVRVGSEFGDPDLSTISLVAAPYGLRHRNLGTVSLLGPTRMDYVKAIDAVRSAAHELSLFVEDVYEE